MQPDIREAAKRARVSEPYLRQCLRRGCDSYALAERLASIYGQPIEQFLYGRIEQGDGTPAKKKQSKASTQSSGRRQRTRLTSLPAKSLT